MTLIVRGRAAFNVFSLLGSDENSATFALGWTLERSRAFRTRFVEASLDARVNLEHVEIHLQKHSEKGGFTDIEFVAADRCHLIIEAKRGWELPSQNQLALYAERFVGAGRSAGSLA